MNEHTTWQFVREAVREPWHYRECGLDDIYLASGYEIVATPYGEAVSIKDQDGLHAAIARHLVNGRKLLNGKEIRFLRKRMDCTQSELARLVGVDAQTVARWEKGETKVPGPADRIIRIIHNGCAGDPEQVTDLLEMLDQIDEIGSDKQVFEKTESGWKEAA